MNTEESVKPVYRSGESLGSILKNNDSVVAQPEPTPVASQEPTPAPVPVNEVPPQPTPDAPADPVAPAENNVSTFSLPDFEEPQDIQSSVPVAAAEPTTDWKDILKKVDVKDVLKEYGFNDFAIEINEHLKNGGDPLDYLNAKAVDYNKISDADIVKSDLKSKYPSFTPQQIDLMFKRQYEAQEGAEQEDIDYTELRLKADAHNIRQQKIGEQQKFKIPTPVQTNNEQQQAAQLAEQQKQMDAARQWFADHEATKSLLSSKRVTLNLGDNGNFNFNIERPELLMKAVTDGETWQRLNLNKQGEPDVAKMQKLALYAFNPEQFESDLVNYGKSLALPQVLKEGQNVSPQAKVIPVDPKSPEKDLWKNAKSSTIGGR